MCLAPKEIKQQWDGDAKQLKGEQMDGLRQKQMEDDHVLKKGRKNKIAIVLYQVYKSGSVGAGRVRKATAPVRRLWSRLLCGVWEAGYLALQRLWTLGTRKNRATHVACRQRFGSRARVSYTDRSLPRTVVAIAREYKKKRNPTGALTYVLRNPRAPKVRLAPPPPCRQYMYIKLRTSLDPRAKPPGTSFWMAPWCP